MVAMPDGLHMSPGSRYEGLGVRSNVDRPVRAEADNASSKLGPGGRTCRRLEHAPELGASFIVLVVSHQLFGLVDRMLVGASAWPPDAIGANGPGGVRGLASPPSVKTLMLEGALLAHARMLKVSSLVACE